MNTINYVIIYSIVCFLNLLFNSYCIGFEQSHIKAAEIMFEQSGIKSGFINGISDSYKDMESHYQNMSISDEEKKIYIKYNHKIIKTIEGEILNGKIHEDIIHNISKIFNENELKEISDFCASDTGKKFIDGYAILMDKYLNNIDYYLKLIGPELKKINLQMNEDLKNYKINNKSNKKNDLPTIKMKISPKKISNSR